MFKSKRERLQESKRAQMWCGFIIFSLILTCVSLISTWDKKLPYGEAWDKAWQNLEASLAQNLLGALIASAFSLLIVSIFFEKRKRYEQADDLVIALGERRILESVGSHINSVLSSGISEVMPIDVEKFESAIKDQFHQANNNDHIIIIDNWHCETLGGGMLRMLKEEILGALTRGANIDFIMLHPNSPLVARREGVLSRNGIAQLIRKCVVQIANIKTSSKSSKGNLRLYLMDTYLSLQVYSFKNVIYQGFYVSDGTSSHQPHLVIEKIQQPPEQVEPNIDKKIPLALCKMLTKYTKDLWDQCQEPLSLHSIEVDLENKIVRGDSAIGKMPLSELQNHMLPIQLLDFEFITWVKDDSQCNLASKTFKEYVQPFLTQAKNKKIHPTEQLSHEKESVKEIIMKALKSFHSPKK